MEHQVDGQAGLNSPAARPGLRLGLLLPAALALLTLAAPRPAAAAEPGVLTLLDGEAVLVIGTRAVAAVPGLRLPAGTLVHTGTETRLLRIEWPDGSRLDLGPATRAMLEPPRLPLPSPRAYLLAGTVKLQQAQASAGLLSPSFELRPFAGAVVLQQSAAQGLAFVETGSALAAPRRALAGSAGSAGSAIALKPGQAATADGTAAPRGPVRPPADWAAALPRAFRDTVPPQLARWQGREPPPARGLPPPDYALLEPWLGAEPLLRRELPARFGERLADASFRAAVLERLPRHPEWGPLLRPPPERRQATAATAAAAAAPPSAPESPR